MLDIYFIAENAELVKKSAKEKGFVNFDIDKLLSVHKELKSLKGSLDDLRAEKNSNAAAMKKASPDERDSLIARGTELKNKIQEQTEKLTVLEEEFESLMMGVPNVVPDDTPLGGDDTQNIVIRTHGEPITFDFTPKDHVQLGKDLDIIDFENGAKVAGAGFYFLKNEAVLLEMALIQFALRKAMERGFTPMRTPELARNEILLGAGYAPKGEESNTYRMEGRDLSLIATSEIAVGGYYSKEMIPENELTKKIVAYSDCFRTEAGGGGRASKGLYRIHQFGKVELFAFTKPEDSDEMLEEILAVEESIYADLGIPYQVMRICAGDLGAPAYKKYDIEAWMPGKEEGGAYGEVTSASNCTDFQARRLKIKYKNSQTGKNEFVHTLNGTAIAMSRTILAILENYQQKDGSVKIPEVLVPYAGISEIKLK